jgi:hypothetical protein
VAGFSFAQTAHASLDETQLVNQDEKHLIGEGRFA